MMKPCLGIVPGGVKWIHVEESHYERLIKIEALVRAAYPHCNCLMSLQHMAPHLNCDYAKAKTEALKKEAETQQAQYEKEAKEQAQALYQSESQGGNGHGLKGVLK